MRIYYSIPADWKELELKVAEVLNESGYSACVNKHIETVRGGVDIDVYAEDAYSTPRSIYLIECKYWTTDIPQTIIHAFRTVVNDYGANYGIIVAKNKFQSGALEAIKNTNIELMNWYDFLDAFESRWLENTINSLDLLSTPLREFTDPLDVEGFDHLDEEGREFYKELLTEFVSIGIYSSSLWYQLDYKTHIYPKEQIDNVINKVLESNILNTDVTCYADFFNVLRAKTIEGINKFKELFSRYI